MRKSLHTLGLSVFIVLVIITIILGFLWGIGNPVPWIGIAILVALPFVHKRMTTRQFVSWSDDLSVGIEVIDEDHKKLLSLINDLQRAVSYCMGESYERQALKELVDYTKYHFEHEEGMLQSHGYPELDAHKKEHEAMIEKVGKFLANYDKDRDVIVDKLTKFLKSWMVTHIRGTDRKYVSYMQEKNVY